MFCLTLLKLFIFFLEWFDIEFTGVFRMVIVATVYADALLDNRCQNKLDLPYFFGIPTHLAK